MSLVFAFFYKFLYGGFRRNAFRGRDSLYFFKFGTSFFKYGIIFKAAFGKHVGGSAKGIADMAGVMGIGAYGYDLTAQLPVAL